MSPGGHAATTVVASAATAFLSGSIPLATAVALGGFFIDVDHAVDYVLFNRQRDLRPAAFLRYYLDARPERVVLALHSWELFALLAAIAWWTGWPLLWGYLGGAAMHLLLDIAFNGELLPTNIVAFYSFAYRAAHGFNGAVLQGHRVRVVPVKFWSAFFKGASICTGEPRTSLTRSSNGRSRRICPSSSPPSSSS
jgi:hypothetical protein